MSKNGRRKLNEKQRGDLMRMTRCYLSLALLLLVVVFVSSSPLTPRADSMKTAVEALKSANLIKPAVSAEAPPKEIEISSLSAGFCNWVYKVDVPKALSKRGLRSSSYVVKIFSPLSHLRLPTTPMMPTVERIVTDRRIGPPSLKCHKDTQVSVYLRGRTLTEKDFHSSSFNRKLCTSVSKKVADLHSSIDLFREMQQREATQGEPAARPANGGEVNMLWFTLDAMLNRLPADPSDGGELVSPQWTSKRLAEEVAFMKAFVEREIGGQDKCVLGHGDLKPSNIMEVEDEKGRLKPRVPAMLIDFELSGPNFRGFDICKLFRTGTPTASSEKNMLAFASNYLQQISRRGKQSGWRPQGRSGVTGIEVPTTPELLVLEAQMFEGLTWLEAGIFFLFAGVEDPAKKKSWGELADDRLKKYEGCKAKLEGIAAKYRALRAQEEAKWKRTSELKRSL